MPARVALLTLSTKARMKDTCALHFQREKAVHADIFWGVGVFPTCRSGSNVRLLTAIKFQEVLPSPAGSELQKSTRRLFPHGPVFSHVKYTASMY